METNNQSKREFLKKLAYAAPAIVTLKVTPALATVGSATYEKPKCDTKLPRYPGSYPGSYPRHKTHGKPAPHKFFDPDKQFFSRRKSHRDDS